jgi:hypothetical protein
MLLQGVSLQDTLQINSGHSRLPQGDCIRGVPWLFVVSLCGTECLDLLNNEQKNLGTGAEVSERAVDHFSSLMFVHNLRRKGLLRIDVR